MHWHGDTCLANRLINCFLRRTRKHQRVLLVVCYGLLLIIYKLFTTCTQTMLPQTPGPFSVTFTTAGPSPIPVATQTYNVMEAGGITYPPPTPVYIELSPSPSGSTPPDWTPIPDELPVLYE